MKKINSEDLKDLILIAKSIAPSSRCLKSKRVAIVSDPQRIGIEFGYNRPIGVDSCHSCLRLERNLHKGYRSEVCRSIHAEVEVIHKLIKRLHLNDRVSDFTLYHFKFEPPYFSNISENPGIPSCTSCAKEIFDYGIPKIVLCGRKESHEYGLEEFFKLSFDYHIKNE